jgi:hypothetical protein
MMSTNKPSVGIVVRVFIGELPYVKGFFDYYINLGVSKFYVIISDVGDFEKIKSYLKDYEPYLSYKVNEKFILNNSFNLVLPELKEDYILSVDVDEFLHVAPHPSIQDYIAATGSADKYTFGWLLSVNDTLSENKIAFEAKGSKQMCRRSLIQSIPNPHKIISDPKAKEVPLSYCLIHYWGRTFNDIIIKCIYGGLNNLKATSLDGVNKDIDKGKVPNRFKMMASLSRRIKTIEIPDFITEKIDYPLEEELLARFQKKERLFELYKKYQESLDYKKHVAIYGDVNLINLVDYLP